MTCNCLIVLENIFETYPLVLNGFLPQLEMEPKFNDYFFLNGNKTTWYFLCEITKAEHKYDGGSRFPYIVVKVSV